MSDGLKDALFGMGGPLEGMNISNPDLVDNTVEMIQTNELKDYRGTVVGTSQVRVTMKDAVKHDANKIPVELLPSQALEEIAKVLAFGAKKYDSWNWAKGFKWTRLIGAAIRHLYAFQRGEDKDPESGLSHLAHAGCCVLFLLQHELSKLGQDDRFKEFTKGDK